MKSIVPLHSLVLAEQSRDGSNFCGIFPDHEIITPSRISHDLVGVPMRDEMSSIIGEEMRRRMMLKLSLGERVVIVMNNFRDRDQRLAYGRVAAQQGASVVYLVNPEASPDRNMLLGDGIAHVISTKRDIDAILPLPAEPLEHIRKKFCGITIFGDVHGSRQSLRAAIEWARSRQHFMFFLGDVIDYGPDTLQVMNSVYASVMMGEAAMMIGNHERKIARWIVQHESGDDSHPLRLSIGNRVTTEALLALPRSQRLQWYGRFRSLLARASLITRMGSLTMVHGAIHPNVWSHPDSDRQAIEDYALYGEQNHDLAERILTHRWVNAVPKGQTVFVGHDVRSTLVPLAVTGTNGGRVVFLDTGSGKGGSLSSADLRFGENGNLILENFNRH